MRVRIDCTIHAVADPDEASSACYVDIFTLVQRYSSRNCRHENSAVNTIRNLEAVDVLSYINITVFAAKYSNILVLIEIFSVSNCDRLVEEAHVLDL